MTNTITQRFREFFKEEWDNAMNKHWGGEWLTADRHRFDRMLQQELSTLFTKFEEEVIGKDLNYRPSQGVDRDTQLIARTLIEERNRLRAEQRQKLAELKKEYMEGEK